MLSLYRISNGPARPAGLWARRGIVLVAAGGLLTLSGPASATATPDRSTPTWSHTERVLVQRAEVRIVEHRLAWRGIEVIGGSSRELHAGGRVVLRTGKPTQDRGDSLTLSPPSTPQPRLDLTAVLDLARAAWGPAGAPALAGPAAAQLHWGADRIHWVWRVAFEADRRSLEHRVAWVDDISATATLGPSRTRFADVGAFERNPVLDPVAAVFAVDSLGEPGVTLAGPRFDVRNCVAPKSGPSCVFAEVGPSAAGDFVFPAPQARVPSDHTQPQDPFSPASVYFHADRLSAFATEHGFELPCAAFGPAVLLSNYRVFGNDGVIPIANAAYTGDCSLLVAFGQGPGADWGYDGDVVYHELTHGLLDQQMGPDRSLGGVRPRTDGVLVDAGAVGEAIADFVASAISGDPQHAEYAAAYDGGQGRDLSNTLGCPAGLVGEVHGDSEPFAGALWTAYEELGDPLVEAVLDAVALFETDTTFEEAAALIVEVTAAERSEEAAATVRAAFEDRGLMACDRWVDIEQMRGELWLSPATGFDRYDPMRPPPFQVSIPIPQGAGARLRVDFDDVVYPDPGWAPVADVHVLLSFGHATSFSYALVEGTNVVDAAPDVHLASINEGFFEVDVPAGTTVFAAFFNQGIHRAKLSNVRATVTVEPGVDGGSSSSSGDGGSGDTGIETENDAASTGSGGETEAPTTGPTPALDDDGGCSCRSAPGGEGGSRGWWLGVWLLLFTRGWFRFDQAAKLLAQVVARRRSR